MTPREILTAGKVVPVIAIDDPAHAVPLAKALVAGGIRVLEVTLRTEHGLQAIRVPGHAERRMRLPDALAERVREIARRQVARTRDLGVNVVGDLERYALAPTNDDPALAPVDDVPADLVDDALTCIRRARGWIPRAWYPKRSRVEGETGLPPVPIREAADGLAAEILTAIEFFQ